MGRAAIAVAIRIPAPPTLAAGPNTVKIAAPIAVPAPSMTRSMSRTPWRSWSVMGSGSEAAGACRRLRIARPTVALDGRTARQIAQLRQLVAAPHGEVQGQGL